MGKKKKEKKKYTGNKTFQPSDSEAEKIEKLFEVTPDPEKGFYLVSREEWGAQPGRAFRKLHTPCRRLRIVYNMNIDRCKDTKYCKKFVYGIQRRHIHWGWPDINVNFLAAGDGNIYEGLGWRNRITRLPHHTVETGNTMVIGCIGRYNKGTVPKRMKKAIDDFIKDSVEQGKIVKEIFDGLWWRIKTSVKL